MMRREKLQYVTARELKLVADHSENHSNVKVHQTPYIYKSYCKKSWYLLSTTSFTYGGITAK